MAYETVQCWRCKEWVIDDLICSNCNALLDAVPCGC